MPDLPTVTRESKVRIGSLSLRVLQLSNGQRIIPAEDIARFCAWLGTEEVSEADLAGIEELRKR